MQQGFPGGSDSKESACNAGDLDSIPGLGRSPGEDNGYPLQYSGLENSIDCIVHGVTKSRPQLSNFHFTSICNSTQNNKTLLKEVIFQARILGWIAISFSRETSQLRDQTQVSCTAGRFFTTLATREAPQRKLRKT